MSGITGAAKTAAAKVPSRVAIAPGQATFSRLIYGCWRLAEDPLGADTARVAAKIQLCADLGITTFDHADIYGEYQCEALFGAALAQLGSHHRETMQLVSKCGIKLLSEQRPSHHTKSYDTSGEHIVMSVEASLRNLRTDYLDLLLIHRPDPLMAAEEVAAAFSILREQGKVLHFGVSNFTPSQFQLLASRLDFPLVTNQVEFSPLHLAPLTDGTFDQCQRLRVMPMAWSPLAGGRIATGSSEGELRLRTALETVGAELDANPEQVAIAWILRHPAQIMPIIGSNDLSRIRAMAAAESFTLSREQWHTIWSAAMGAPVP